MRRAFFLRDMTVRQQIIFNGHADTHVCCNNAALPRILTIRHGYLAHVHSHVQQKEDFMSPNTHPRARRALAVVVATVLVAGAYAPIVHMAALIMA